MSDDFYDIFDEQPSWDGSTENDAGFSQPPMPPNGDFYPNDDDYSPRISRRQRREMEQRRNRRRMVIGIILVLALVLLVVGGYCGARAVSGAIAKRNENSKVEIDYPGPGTGEVQFNIDSGESVTSIASRLQKLDVVKSADAFASSVGANNSTLYPGSYTLKKRMSSAQAVNVLSDPTKAGGIVQVRAGERISQVFAEASAVSGIDQAQFSALSQAGGDGILPPEANGSFEGWFEPGSYIVKGKKSAAEVLKPMVDKRIAKLDEMKAPTGAERERMLIIASIAESEVNSQAYYGKVSRVILNRLNINMPLGMDSTVAYGAGVKPNALTDAMLSDSSNRYNTRINRGLPPTPISSPGDNALQAAMNPEQGDWLYFVTTNLKTGETKFTSSDTEFMKLRDEYKRSNANAN